MTRGFIPIMTCSSPAQRDDHHVLPSRPTPRTASVSSSSYLMCTNATPSNLCLCACPGEQGGGCHDPVQPKVAGQQSCERCDHGPVSPVRLRPGDTAAPDRDFMPQCQDLHILGDVASGEEHQSAEHPEHEQIDEAEEHDRRGWKPRSDALHKFWHPTSVRAGRQPK
jgi:hypothetical protein